MAKILVTGSEGLIGRYVTFQLRRANREIVPFDIKLDAAQDVCNSSALGQALHDVEGVVHLAAVSRVAWGEQDPLRCWNVNVGGLRNLLHLSASKAPAPWIVFASSREVYGNADTLPVVEDTPFSPLNIYARSKCEGEIIALEARSRGIRVNICRLSNVYGCPYDHLDRVVPAFARAAALGGRLIVEGAGNTFDFTHVEDVARGVLALVEMTEAGALFPPIQFVTGVGTTLQKLAEYACAAGITTAETVQAPPRSFDASCFIGDTTRSRRLLGWRAQVSIDQAISSLVGEFMATRV